MCGASARHTIPCNTSPKVDRINLTIHFLVVKISQYIYIGKNCFLSQEFKWSVKYHRARSVHVTPTVFLNGLEAPDISSGWGLGEWNEKIQWFVDQGKST